MSKTNESNPAGNTVIKVGFDLGTNTSVISASVNDEPLQLSKDILFTAVGYARPNVLPWVLPDRNTTLFGDEALKYWRYLDVKWPVDRGVIKDVKAAVDFVNHVKATVSKKHKGEIWSVIGVPANVDPQDSKRLRAVIGNNFDRFLMMPEPFLAALGIRDDSRLKDSTYLDPTRASVIVDIGAGTTDVSRVFGFYPTAEDQICIPKAGNNIDSALRKLIEGKYPDVDLDAISLTKIKEDNSYVGSPSDKVLIKVLVAGKERVIDITEEVGQACSILTQDIVDAVTTLIHRGGTQNIEDQLIKNVILVGGGSQITNLATMIESKLKSQNYELASVRVATKDYKRLVSKGALKVAQTVRDDQWQFPTVY